MRKKETWMKKYAIVRANGRLGMITKMEENRLDDVDYVYYITVKVNGKDGRYHPDDIQEAK